MDMESEFPTERPAERRFWYLKTPEGSVYGPAAWEKLQAWVEQGRVTDDCQLAASEPRDWQPAVNIFPQLKPQPAIPVENSATAEVPTADVGGSEPRAPIQHVIVATAVDDLPFLKRHRGGLILILGLLGLLMACPIFSLMAWVMGSEDLRAMQAGQMDLTGQRNTLVGQRMGMVLSLVWIVGCMLALFGMLVSSSRG
jgi:hypothetical protein